MTAKLDPARCAELLALRDQAATRPIQGFSAYSNIAIELALQLEAALELLKQAREVLEFYSSLDSYKVITAFGMKAKVLVDRGGQAKRVLAKLPEDAK